MAEKATTTETTVIETVPYSIPAGRAFIALVWDEAGTQLSVVRHGVTAERAFEMMVRAALSDLDATRAEATGTG